MTRSRQSAKAAGTRFERLMSRVQTTPSGCWKWTGARLVSGYGSARWEGRAQVVHRIVYSVLVGQIPADSQLDHLCRNRICCRPDHLEPVSQAENLRRGQGWGGLNAAKTHCPDGHPYTPENTYSRPSAPDTRECRKCRRANRARAYAKARSLA